MYSLLGSLDNHGRRMTRSTCGSSRHSAGASRRHSFLKRRTLFLYASPTTVNGAFTPSNRRVVARATWAIVWWRCAWPDARRRAASMASASLGASGGAGCEEARARVHMSLVVNGASGAARRATKFVRSARDFAGVASDNIASATRAVALGRVLFFGRCLRAQPKLVVRRAVRSVITVCSVRHLARCFERVSQLFDAFAKSEHRCGRCGHRPKYALNFETNVLGTPVYPRKSPVKRRL